MIGTEIRPESQELLLEDEEFRQFQAVFEKFAASLGNSRVQLSEIGSYLWEERSGLPEKFPSEEKAFKRMVKTIIGGAHYNARLVIGEREPALNHQGKQNRRSARRYSTEEVSKLGPIFWFYLKDVSENPGLGRWERVKTQCQKNFPELFGFLSRPTMAEEDLTEELLLLPLEMTADEARNLFLNFKERVQGKEFNTVSGIHLAQCGINMEFVNRAYLLYCKLHGRGPIREEYLSINNSAFLQILDFLGRYLRENNLTLGKAIEKAQAVAEKNQELKMPERAEEQSFFSLQELENYLASLGARHERRTVLVALRTLGIPAPKVESSHGGKIYRIFLTSEQIDNLIEFLNP